jgi:hypothetical protein
MATRSSQRTAVEAQISATAHPMSVQPSRTLVIMTAILLWWGRQYATTVGKK